MTKEIDESLVKQEIDVHVQKRKNPREQMIPKEGTRSVNFKRPRENRPREALLQFNSAQNSFKSSTRSSMPDTSVGLQLLVENVSIFLGWLEEAPVGEDLSSPWRLDCIG